MIVRNKTKSTKKTKTSRTAAKGKVKKTPSQGKAVAGKTKKGPKRPKAIPQAEHDSPVLFVEGIDHEEVGQHPVNLLDMLVLLWFSHVHLYGLVRLSSNNNRYTPASCPYSAAQR